MSLQLQQLTLRFKVRVVVPFSLVQPCTYVTITLLPGTTVYSTTRYYGFKLQTMSSRMVYSLCRSFVTAELASLWD